MSNYKVLINILDKIREDAPNELVFYNPDDANIEKINQARSRAYIHLFLKAQLGILDFRDREKYITDGSQDGGIDAYYIDKNSKTILFIQSKFRTTEKNFDNKEISLDEILKMDIDRILKGETSHENGVKYNGKIIGMQREMKSIPDMARYKYEVIILANLNKISDEKIRRLTSGIPAKIYDSEKTFSDLVFPIVTGTYYNYSDLYINVNLSNKSTGAHINYSVDTAQGNCDITVLFIPLMEIGKIMYRYKNSILKYNPRSYLTLKEGSINDGIKQTALKNKTNEFALFNNGITLLSDETSFNQRIGQKDRAQLSIKNPQIINGGQTSYTISILYEEVLSGNDDIAEKLLEKEVLVKIITFGSEISLTLDDKLELIEQVSEATNKQNTVNNADRNSNNPLLIATQKALFLNFGILLERKRGEFFDGLRYEYIDKTNIIDRSVFMRIAFSTLGYPVPPKKEKQLLTEAKINKVLNDNVNYRKYFFGSLLYSELQSLKNKNNINNSTYYSIISVCSTKYYDAKLDDKSLKIQAQKAINEIMNKWIKFEDYVISLYHNRSHFKYSYNFLDGTYRLNSRFSNYYRSKYVAFDLNNYFFSKKKVLEEENINRNNIPNIKDLLGYYLTLEQIELIKPMIDKENWYSESSIKNISEKYTIDPRSVRKAISLVTSKEVGIYFA